MGRTPSSGPFCSTGSHIFCQQTPASGAFDPHARPRASSLQDRIPRRPSPMTWPPAPPQKLLSRNRGFLLVQWLRGAYSILHPRRHTGRRAGAHLRVRGGGRTDGRRRQAAQGSDPHQPARAGSLLWQQLLLDGLHTCGKEHTLPAGQGAHCECECVHTHVHT